jgi:putative DNA methylase
MMTKPYKKKLIEVAIPLEAINAASAREKSIRHGHPSTLHLWWARRPLAACRAVLFAQLVDDPSGYADKLLHDPKIRKQAKEDLVLRLKAWRDRKADAQGNVPDTPEPTLEDCAADIERKRLFEIIEELVLWENSTNEEVLARARAEIRRSCGGVLPTVYDPFSGGGSIPLEAQRLGLTAYGSDLNPVAVMIGKAMIEIPPKFKDMPPIHPGIKERTFYRNAEGLAEDVKYYGEWMRDKAWERIGHLYPQVDLPKEYGGGKGTVVAWIWARTVPSPDPAFADVHVPLVTSYMLSSKKGGEARIEPKVDRSARSIFFQVFTSGTAAEWQAAKSGTKAGAGSNFRCLMSGSAITTEYLRTQAAAGNLGQKLIAMVVQMKGSRVFVSPTPEHEIIANSCVPDWAPDQKISADRRAFTPPDFGMQTFGDLYTARQLVALNTYSDLIADVKVRVNEDVKASKISQASDYADAISVYLALAISKLSDIQNSLVSWKPSMVQVIHLFTRQAIPIVWDFAEPNLFAESAGDFGVTLSNMMRALATLGTGGAGSVRQHDAQTAKLPSGAVLSTDPPYYDNVGYSDLSDFFLAWLRRNLRDVYPDLFSTLSAPKSEELIAAPYRHGSREKAEDFFLSGMRKAISNISGQVSADFPATIYYAFKQSEMADEGVSSTGWATFLQAVFEAGFSVVGTWPVRTELANRIRGIGANALANSVVLVCRKKEATAEVITRAEFIRKLKRELPPAIAELQAASIAPADMPQSAIGPGMGVFSRYKAVLESDDSPMTVKAALQLINRELDEYLGGIQGEFDADTRFAITWFEQHGMAKGDYGAADSLARARGISVESVKHAGIVESAAGNVRILPRDELEHSWDPHEDRHLTVWECLQYLLRQHEKEGISHDTALLLKKIDAKAEAVKDLAYCLYDISANKRKDAKEATAYNALIADWTELTRQAAAIHDTSGDRQIRLDV